MPVSVESPQSSQPTGTRNVAWFAWLVALLAGAAAALPLAWWFRAGLAAVLAGSLTAWRARTLVRRIADAAHAHALSEARLRRAERVAAWRDIARQLAHEVKNPLTPIRMGVELLRKARARQLPEFDALFEEQTSIVLEEVERLRELVVQFSSFARTPKPRPVRVELEERLSHVLALRAGDASCELTAETRPEASEVRADPDQLTQVLLNLVDNAVRAAVERAAADPSGPPPAVHVQTLALRDDRVALRVEDNGAGIDPAVRERLFEPYVTTRKGRGGTGLGLAIAQRIVEDHGGEITVESSSRGTRFDVVLPRAGPARHALTLEDTLAGAEDQRVT